MSVSLIILTLDEAEGMRQIVPQIQREWVDEIVVVDGGSTDGTLEEAQRQGLTVVQQERPGRGEAFRCGLRNSTGDILVYFSPDGNERVEDMPKLADKIREGYDMAIASRFGKDSQTFDAPPITRLGNRFFSLIANLFFRAGVTDAINGFRAVTRRCMEDLNTTSNHFEIELEMTIRAAKKGYRIGEIPTVEGTRIGGEAKLNKVPEVFRYFRLVARELLRRD